ncbi:hypothetical protein MPPM_4735 [Methylorubrum populi]|uniref:Uncharacterized protein n=1 Tax=Methylorubrum populi TaxID=223967 RepID=A0A160PMT1_9HYPH|nr:hypothetical protein MPPM_4735 [Methylorubrum populi]
MAPTRLRMRIRCAVCDKPVDEWTMWENPADMSRGIKVRCHGEEDSMKMTWGFLADLTPDERRRLEQSEGVAFATKRLPRPTACKAEG